MDDDLRRKWRRATHPEARAQFLRSARRSGLLSEDRLFLAALLGDTGARRALADDVWPAFLSREWIELLALLGPEVCVRVVVAFGRFYGGDERSVEAVSVGDRWLAAVGTAEADAVAEEARQMSIEGTLECWERISRLIFCPSDHLDSELWLLLGDERGREDLGKCEDAVCAEVCKWALAI